MSIRPLKVRTHILRDVQLKGWKENIAGCWDYTDLVADTDWREGWISFDAVTYNPLDGSIYCGLNSIDGDLLYRYSPEKDAFQCLESRRFTDSYDVKIHRTLLLSPDNKYFYFATSLLHDANEQGKAPGGKLVRYDLTADRYEVLCIPIPHLYIQSLAADWSRQILYGFTYPAEFVFRYDLKTGKFSNLAYVGNAIMLAQPHNAIVDKYGYLWGTYAETRAWDENTGPLPVRLFRYHPDSNEMNFLRLGLARRNDSVQLTANPFDAEDTVDLTETRHRNDYGFCDAMLYDGNQYIYAGSVAGVLSRIDVESLTVEKIATMIPSGRLPALGFDSHGRVICGGGMRGRTAIAVFDPKANSALLYAEIRCRETGQVPARIHELCITPDDTIYFGENDNHKRSSYLWSVRLP